MLQQLKDAITRRLPELDLVLGWEMGFDPFHATPLYIREAADVERLVVGPWAVHNLATYLPGLKGKKVGIVVKGCDSRSVIQLASEGLIRREDVTVFGLCCDGVVSHRKLRDKLPADLGFVEEAQWQGDVLRARVAGQEVSVRLSDVLADKCVACRYPNALGADVLVGSERTASPQPVACQEAFDALSSAEKQAFWQETMTRCIRCYACRNACPMCVCRDHCIATSRDPLWLGQENSPAENFMFQMIHVMHLAGRCTECGECERACPVDIPLLLLRRHMNRVTQDLFAYEAGTIVGQTPPLLTFQVEEAGINERGW
jgi:ferredoxin